MSGVLQPSLLIKYLRDGEFPLYLRLGERQIVAYVFRGYGSTYDVSNVCASSELYRNAEFRALKDRGIFDVVYVPGFEDFSEPVANGAAQSGPVLTTRALIAGAGLTGGGDLSADRTFNVVAHADGSITVNANDIQIGILATDAQHGSRGGGSQHELAVADGAAGFLSGTDKTKLDALPATSASSAINLTAGAGLIGGGDLSADRTFTAVAHADGSIVVNANDIQVGILASDVQHGSRGGGSQHELAVASGAAGFLSGTDKAKLDILPAESVGSDRTLTAGAGLTGGGNLSADRTFNVVANADGSITVNANDIQVGILASDVQHGSRGGGSQHALAIASGAAGFLSGTDKTKLDGLPVTSASSAVNLTAGAGLTGGGDLSADRTFNAVANADGSIVVNANDIQIGILASDAQHGSRGGSSQHEVAIAGGAAGFLSGTDKTKLDALSVAANIMSYAGDGWDGAAASLTGALTNDINLFSSATTSGNVTPRTSQQVGVLRVNGTLTLNHILDASGVGGVISSGAAGGSAGSIASNGGAATNAPAGSGSGFWTVAGLPTQGTAGAAGATSSVGGTGGNGAVGTGTGQGGSGGGGGGGGGTSLNTGGIGGIGGAAVVGTRAVARVAAYVHAPESLCFNANFTAATMGIMGGGGGGGGPGGGGAGGAVGVGGVGTTGRTGGKGGGGWWIGAAVITGTGTIRANGAAGTISQHGGDSAAGSGGAGGGAAGGAGGGGGGFVIVKTPLLGGGITLEANGGAGGAGTATGGLGDGLGRDGGPGGAGGNGAAGQVWSVIL